MIEFTVKLTLDCGLQTILCIILASQIMSTGKPKCDGNFSKKKISGWRAVRPEKVGFK